MSIALFNQVKSLQEQVTWLQHELETVSERLLALESARDSPHTELDVDTLEPVKRGRPRKVDVQ